MVDYAVVVGVEHYPEGRFKPLKGAINDANDFYNWLVNGKGGNLQKENCALLTSHEELSAVLLSQIEEAILDKCQSAENDSNGGRFYFFFSGHGLGAKPTETALILSDWVEGLPRSLGAHSWKQSLLNKGAFKEVFFLLDCCRDRAGIFTPSSLGLNVQRVHEEVDSFKSLIGHATTYLDSAFEGNVSNTGKNRKNGFFTAAVIRALKGEAATKGVVTFEGFKKFVEKETKLIAQKGNRSQTAIVDYTHNADDAFVTIDEIKKQVVKIQLMKPSNGPFVIKDGELEVVARFEERTKLWEIELDNGLYVIEDSKGNEQLIRITINLNTPVNVKF